MKKIILIIGASRGLGFYLVEESLKRGYTVVAMARQMHENLKELIDEVGDRILFLQADMKDYESIKSAAKIAREKFEYIDVIINAVGLWTPEERIILEDEKFDFDMIMEDFDVNAVAPIRVVREFIGMAKKSNGKTIINVSSECGCLTTNPRDCEYAYCMSKAALNMATKIFDNAYGKEGFKVYTVDPGWMRTDMGGPTATTDPADTAVRLLNLAEEPKKPFVFVNRTSEKSEW